MEDAEQVDAQYQHHGRYDETEYERGGRIESEGGAERSDDAAEYKERDEPPDMEQNLRPHPIALFSEGCRHREHQPADHRHAGGERRDNTDDKRGAVGNRAYLHQVNNPQLL